MIMLGTSLSLKYLSLVTFICNVNSGLNIITSSVIYIYNAHAQMLLCTAFLILSIVLFVAYHVDLGLGKQST